MNKLNSKLINTLIIIAIVCLLYSIKALWIGLVVKLFEIIAPFLLAFAIAYVLYPLVRKLIDAGSPKWLAILAVSILGVGSLLLIILLTIPLLYEQILLFISNISVLLTDLSTKFEINLGGLQSALTNFSKDVISNLGSNISNGALSIVNTSIEVFSTAIVSFCAAIYFLVDMDKIRNSIKEYLSLRNRKLLAYFKTLDTEFTKYAVGMGLNMIIQGIEYTLAFLIIGHPNYLVLGILSGISAIIPWFGGFMVAIISLLVSSVISTKMFILTAIICIICPILDGNVIGPKVYGKTNSLHPLLVIFAVSAGGVIAGFWGIVISLPVAIAIRITLNFYKKSIFKTIKNMKAM